MDSTGAVSSALTELSVNAETRSDRSRGGLREFVGSRRAADAAPSRPGGAPDGWENVRVSGAGYFVSGTGYSVSGTALGVSGAVPTRTPPINRPLPASTLSRPDAPPCTRPEATEATQRRLRGIIDKL